MKQTSKIMAGALNLAYRMGYIDRDEEIVRCKDCRRWGPSYINYNEHFCHWHEHVTEADDFCSLAEKKEEGKENG